MKKKILLHAILLNCFFIAAYAQQRVVLIEQFTNSGCPPCASSTPPVLQFADDHPAEVVAVAYHTSFPYNDSMYHENPLQSAARVNHYGVSGVPYTIVDGNFYSNTSSAFLSVMQDTINSRLSVPSSYNIGEISNTVMQGVLESRIVFSSLSGSNAGDSLHAMVVVVEKEVMKSDYVSSPGANTETSYKYVMRRILTSNTGDPLKSRFAGGKDTFGLNWNILNIKNVNEIRVVAFVQNYYTDEVYQASMFSPVVAPSVPEISEKAAINIFPNPASGLIFIESSPNTGALVVITDLTGRVKLNFITEDTRTGIDVSSLSKGVYILNYTVGTNSTSKKLVIN
ncbi:MAG TPA: T9SS type A sorting domain-containing protein [Bacteroidia bacterium]|jgi:thiol-disulfide isomerase/thioredoxin